MALSCNCYIPDLNTAMVDFHKPRDGVLVLLARVKVWSWRISVLCQLSNKPPYQLIGVSSGGRKGLLPVRNNAVGKRYYLLQTAGAHYHRGHS